MELALADIGDKGVMYVVVCTSLLMNKRVSIGSDPLAAMMDDCRQCGISMLCKDYGEPLEAEDRQRVAAERERFKY